MKQLIITIGMITIIFITSLILWCTQSKKDNRDQLEKAVSAAVKQTVKHSAIENQKEIQSNSDMINQFIQIMSINIPANKNLKIEVMEVDYKEGILDVLVTENYNYIMDKNVTIQVRKCAIYQ